MTQVTFGFSLLPSTDLAAHRELVAVAEDGGLDRVGIQDHPYASRHVETFALTATLLARTSRLRFFPDVASLPLRPPASTRVAAQGAVADTRGGAAAAVGDTGSTVAHRRALKADDRRGTDGDHAREHQERGLAPAGVASCRGCDHARPGHPVVCAERAELVAVRGAPARPDIGMLGYLAGTRVGAAVYNAFHTYPAPGVLAAVGLLTDRPLAVALALIWFAHIGMDRLFGYGLKYPTHFKDTHLSHV